MAWAVITGASAGLGEAFAWCFARDQHNVILVARREQKLRQLAERLRHDHRIEAHVIAQDLAENDAATKVFKGIQQLQIEPDYLVNNAGFGSMDALTQRPLQEALCMVSVNINALISLTHLCLPSMLNRAKGRILNIGSTAGFQPGPYMATYYATKAFVNSFSQALAWELRNTGVTVTLSCPGPTLTEFSKVARLENSKLFIKQAMPASRVAKEAYDAMMQGKRRVIHGLQNAAGAHVAPLIPSRWLLPVVASLNQK